VLQDLIAKPWPELVAIGEEAMQNQDILTLQDLDGVVRYRFVRAIKRHEPVSEFITSVLRILATREATEILAEAGETEVLLAQWEVLLRLAEVEEQGRELERNTVERHVVGRPRRQQIFDLVAGKSEIRFQEIKAALGVSDANLSGLLGELEAHEIVRRERRGSETWVRLDSAGIAYQKGNVVPFQKQTEKAIRSVLAEEELPHAVGFK
jgi:DNA-binding transcriptional ArsR family regulator